MAPKVRKSVRIGSVASVVSALAMVVACGGSSGQFLGGSDDGGGAADGGSSSSSSSGTSGTSGASSSGASSGGTSGTSGASSSGASGTSGTSGASSSGTSGTSGAPDAGPFCGVPDAGAFPGFADGCTANDACVIGFHLQQCCGVYAALGLNHSAQNNFDKAEQLWESGCAACKCVQGDQAVAQDGKTGPKSSVLVKCEIGSGSLTGKCVSYIP